jgi:multidrug efflux pump subunit AcrB
MVLSDGHLFELFQRYSVCILKVFVAVPILVTVWTTLEVRGRGPAPFNISVKALSAISKPLISATSALASIAVFVPLRCLKFGHSFFKLAFRAGFGLHGLAFSMLGSLGGSEAVHR